MDDQPPKLQDSNANQPQPSRSNPASFLFKVLAPILIVGLVIAFLLPAYRSATGAARRNSCMNHLKQIGIALENYAAAKGSYPPAYTTDADGKPLHSWRTLILPYLEQQQLYEQIDLTKPWDDPVNEKARNSTVEVYRCPSLLDEDGDNRTTYLAVVTPDSVIRTTASRRREDIENVASRTLVGIDADPAHAVPWMSPQDADEQLILALGESDTHSHGDGVLALFADGHPRMLADGVDAPIRRALISVSADDNDVLTDDE